MEIAHRGHLPRVKGQLAGILRAEVGQLVIRQRDQGGQMIRVPAQGFPPVPGGTDGRVAILLRMHAQQVQFLCALELIHGGIVRDGLRHFLQFVFRRLFIAQQRLAPVVYQLERGDLLRQGQVEGLLRPGGEAVLRAVDDQLRISQGNRGLQPQTAAFHGQGRFPAGAERRAAVAHGVPHLGKFLALVGVQPREVRLIEGVAAGHQLGVSAVGVGQRPLPTAGQLIIGPGEHLLAHAHMTVGHVHHAAALAFVVAAEEIILRGRAEIGRGLVRVLMIGNIRAVAQPDAVVHAGGHGIFRHILAVVELDVMHIRREHQPVLLIHGHGGVFPPQEGVPGGRAVVHLHPGIEPCFSGTQAYAYHALHTVQRLVFAHPHRNGAVFFFLHLYVHGHIGAGPVVAGPVEFQTAGDPAAQQADQRGLHHVLPVEEVVAGAFIHGGVDAAAQFGHKLDLQIFVFQRDDAEGLFGTVDPIHPHDHLIGIGIAAGALMHPVFREHGHFFSGGRIIGGHQANFIRNFGFLKHGRCLLYFRMDLFTIPVGSRRPRARQVPP